MRAELVNHNITKASDWDAMSIVAAVHRAGTSLRQIAFAHGLVESTVRAALRHSSPCSEKLIAEALNLPVVKIWPERVRARRQKSRLLKRPVGPRKVRSKEASDDNQT